MILLMALGAGVFALMLPVLIALIICAIGSLAKKDAPGFPVGLKQKDA